MKIIIIIFTILFFNILPAYADSIKVGSKRFPESNLLAEMISQLIENKTNLTVDRKFGLGSTSICFEAINSGNIDIYPEYTGTGLTAVLKEEIKSNDPQKVFDQVYKGFKEKYKLIWLDSLGFNNTYAIAINKKIDAKNISDLEKLKDSLHVAFSHEFINRDDGYKGLSKYYGFSFNDVKGMEHGLVYKSIQTGDIDLTDAYSTDGNLIKYNLVLLKDDKGFFPPYYAAPIIREEVLNDHPELKEVIGSLKINDQEIIDLNYKVEVKGESFEQVAKNFLIDKKLIKGEKTDNAKELPVVRLLIDHIALTLIATSMSILIGLPLGIFISKYSSFASPVLSFAGVIQTFPSLAILGFMIPLFGIGKTPAIAALFLYGLLPIIRNTYTGITSIDPALKEAGKGMGMTPAQIMLNLELPLSVKIIMAGIRTAMVINIGTATLAAFIGAGGLGELIVTGLSLNDNETILWGAIPAAVLALVVDFLLARLERLLEPKGLKIRLKN